MRMVSISLYNSPQESKLASFFQNARQFSLYLLPFQTPLPIIEQWKELLYMTNTFLVEEAELEESGEDSNISLAEVTEVLKKAPVWQGVDEIHPQMLKAFGHCWAVWADIPVQCHAEVGNSAYGVARGGCHF